MSATERVINDLNVAKLMLCNPQILTPETCVRIGQTINSAIDLLKEEPVKPVVNVDEWVCGNCGLSVEQQRMIHPNAIFHDFFEYCPHCGKKVDWEAVKQDG